MMHSCRSWSFPPYAAIDVGAAVVAEVGKKIFAAVQDHQMSFKNLMTNLSHKSSPISMAA